MAGSSENGLLADLIVEADPAKDIALWRVKLVIKDGEFGKDCEFLKLCRRDEPVVMF